MGDRISFAQGEPQALQSNPMVSGFGWQSYPNVWAFFLQQRHQRAACYCIVRLADHVKESGCCVKTALLSIVAFAVVLPENDHLCACLVVSHAQSVSDGSRPSPAELLTWLRLLLKSQSGTCFNLSQSLSTAASASGVFIASFQAMGFCTVLQWHSDTLFGDVFHVFFC